MHNTATEIADRMAGCLLGQAIGDALGLGTEFMSKKEVKENYPCGLQEYSQIVRDSHRSRWPQGSWTDDTDMMLCILKAYDDGRFDTRRVARNFKYWFNGIPMGIGSLTDKVLGIRDYEEMPEDCARMWWEVSRRRSAPNGAVMRTSVVGLAPEDVEQQAEAICRLTHWDPRCVGSCVIVSRLIHELVWKGREVGLEEIREVARRYDERILPWVETAFADSDISTLALDDEATIGYTLRTLAAALWAYRHAVTFEEGLLTVVNEGGDADTNAAVACAVLGAKFGAGAIPVRYVAGLHETQSYQKLASDFITKAMGDAGQVYDGATKRSRDMKES